MFLTDFDGVSRFCLLSGRLTARKGSSTSVSGLVQLPPKEINESNESKDAAEVEEKEESEACEQAEEGLAIDAPTGVVGPSTTPF